MSVCPPNSWDAYLYTTDDGPVVVGFHTEANKIDRGTYPFCARVIISIKAPNHNGGPTDEEAEMLWKMEDRLVELLDESKAPCLLLGRLTHSGFRELVFQVADYEPFRPPVGKWMMDHEEYETDVSEHDGWDFYFESVWPSETSWLMIMDRRVVEQLVKAGSDRTREHSLEFVFRGHSEGLAQMRDALHARGYSLIAAESDGSRLVMALTMPLDADAIFRESLRHHEDCRKFGITYDGWGASVVS